MVTLSLSHLTVLDAGPVELVEAASAGGFDGVELRLFPHPGAAPTPLVAGDEQVTRAVAGRCADLGVRVSQVEVFGIFPVVDRDLFLRALDTGAALGARSALSLGLDPEPARYLDTLAWLTEEAATRGLRVGVEFMPYAQVRTLAQAVAAVRSIGRPEIGLVVDALHLSRSGGTPEDLADVPGDLFVSAQLCDARAGRPVGDALVAESRTDRLLPGTGALRLGDLLDRLPADLPLAAEVPATMLRHLSVVERGRVVGGAVRAWLESRDRAVVAV